jgi:hypothetical protein
MAAEQVRAGLAKAMAVTRSCRGFKEFEAPEKLADKVKTPTVHNGARGSSSTSYH